MNTSTADANADASVEVELKALPARLVAQVSACLLYTSDAADERSSVDLGGRRIIKKKKQRGNVCVGAYIIKNTSRQAKSPKAPNKKKHNSE